MQVARRTVWPKSIFSITTSFSASRTETSSPIERSEMLTSSAHRSSTAAVPSSTLTRASRTSSGDRSGRYPRRPKLTPRTGTSAAAARRTTRRNVPSPPMLTATVVPARSTAPRSTSTPASATRSGPLKRRMRATSPRSVSQAAVSVASANASGRSGWTRKVTVAIGEDGSAGRVGRGQVALRLRHGGGDEGGGLLRLGPLHALAGVQQEFDVAGGAGEGGGHRPHDAGSGAMERGHHSLERAQPERRVSHHPLAPGDGGATRLELRLDQEDQVGVRGRD